MSSELVGGLAHVDFPDGWNQTTSWERAKQEDTEINRVGRAEWMVKVGDGSIHRCLYALEDGEVLGDCDCRGYRHGDGWCAHLAALLLAYVRHEIKPSDLSTPVDDELRYLWAARPDGGDDRTRGVRR